MELINLTHFFNTGKDNSVLAFKELLIEGADIINEIDNLRKEEESK